MSELITKLQQIKTSVNNIQNELSAAGVIYSPFISAWQGVVTLKEQVISAGADKQELINELSNLQNQYESIVVQFNDEHERRVEVEAQKTEVEHQLAEKTSQFNDLQIEYDLRCEENEVLSTNLSIAIKKYDTLSGEYDNLSALYDDTLANRDQLLAEMTDAITMADDILN